MLKDTKIKLILVLIFATVFAYLSSLGNPFIWDDEQFITSNTYVRQFDIVKIFTTNTVAGAGVTSNYYRPLTTLSFAVDAKIWSFGSAQDKGQNPFGFHLTNLALHIGAGLLLFGLLGELGLPKVVSFFVALLFLIHPVQVEAVSYINSRGDSLYTCFLFLGLWLFTLSLRGRANSDVILRHQPKNLMCRIRSFAFAQDDKLGWIMILAIVVTYILSLLSKEIALAGVGLFPLILLSKNKEKIIQYTNKRISEFFEANKAAILVVLLLIVITAIYLFLRLTVLNFGNTLNFYGANNVYTNSLAIRLFTFAKVLWIYLGLLVWPYPLHMERSVALVTNFWSPWVLGMVGLVACLGLLGTFELKKRRTAWILFGLLWFLGMLVPGSGIIPINGILYEHWLYVPSVGLWLMVYGIIQFFSLSLRGAQQRSNPEIAAPITFVRNDVGKKILISFVSLFSILYIFLTIRQNNIWADPITFYGYTLQFAPDSARLHNNLGMSLADVGDNKKAVTEYEKALALDKGYPQIYNNLGNAYFGIGNYSLAEKELTVAIRENPNFLVAYINLLKTYVYSGQKQKAEREVVLINHKFPGKFPQNPLPKGF